MKKAIFALLVPAGLMLASCGDSSHNGTPKMEASASGEKTSVTSDSILYKTENLSIRQISAHVYVHESYLQTQSFGKVSCNGMLVVNEKEAVIFDTPTDNETAKELIAFVNEKLNSKINAVVATHFHEDCIGGLKAFHDESIPSYASQKTIEILREKEDVSPIPENGFDEILTLNVGNEIAYAEFFGEGHTKDNVIGYFPKDKAIFGGCLIKETGANKGYLGDANVQVWPETVNKLKNKYQDTKIVIPGHGKSGGTELLDYTIELFR